MKARRIALSLCASAAMVMSFTVPAVAQGKVKCGDNGPAATANVDPILYHNKPVGSGHLHQIFGNADWVKMSNPNAANYADLEGKNTDCRLSADTAGYWQPAVVDTRNGNVLQPRQFTAYYRSFDSKTFGEGMAFPADTRLVAMQWTKSPGAYGWTCGQFENVSPQETIPDCSMYSQKPGHVLTLHVNFPSCWDGVRPNHKAGDVGNTSDNEHYAYPVRSGKKWVCPAGFPNKMVQLRENVQYPNPNKIPVKYLEASSDMMMGGHNGSSMHADFWNAWVQPQFETFVKNCVNNKANYNKKACMP